MAILEITDESGHNVAKYVNLAPWAIDEDPEFWAEVYDEGDEADPYDEYEDSHAVAREGRASRGRHGMRVDGHSVFTIERTVRGRSRRN